MIRNTILGYEIVDKAGFQETILCGDCFYANKKTFLNAVPLFSKELHEQSCCSKCGKLLKTDEVRLNV